MRRTSKFAALIGAALIAVLTIAPPASAHGGGGDGGGHRPSTKVLLTDLSSPKGLAVNGNHNLIVGQGAFGPPGPALEFVLRGPDKGQVNEVSGVINLTDVVVSPVDDTGWGIGPNATDGVSLYHQLADGTVVEVLDMFAYQASDPDPVDHDDPPNPTESNPYGLAAMRNGDILVADAAANDVVRVRPDGSASTVARFDLQSVKTDHIPPGSPFGPLPKRLDAEAVPTSVAIGPDGSIYVGELKGFPFRPGTSNIWRIEPDATNAWCSVDEPDPTRQCQRFSSGYTGIQDLAFGNGKMYVYELAVGGVLAFEPALDPTSGVPFPPAILLEVRNPWRWDGRREIARGQLSQPGGVIVVDGRLYVTDGMFTTGRQLRVAT